MPTRRLFLQATGLGACSAAAYPLLSSVTLAGAPTLGENRLVVVILRGAMDGMDLLRPVGDPMWPLWRPGLATGDGLPLDGMFALHPELAPLMPLWRAGSLGFVPATSTPYRDKRSHFDGQDMLEAGTGPDVAPAAARDGWLNRMLQAVPGLTGETAFALGRDAQPLLEGAFPARLWSPDVALELSAQGRRLLDHVYHDDPLFRDAATEAMELAALGLPPDDPADDAAGGGAGGMTGGGAAAGRLGDIDPLVDFAAGRLREETRIAAFSLSGWDTHRAQASAIRGSLRRLARMVTRMEAELGPAIWERTLMLAVTEFGRTVAENGSGGTDHGTAGAMLAAGGAARGGIHGGWPGLEESALYDRRDLMPLSDLRDWTAQALQGMFGLDRALLETAVFPGLVMEGGRRLLR
jgi:uncharacterized protein (DUF1501 family)